MYDQKRTKKLRHQLDLLKDFAWQETSNSIQLHHFKTEDDARKVLSSDWQNWPQVGGDFAWGAPASHHWFAGTSAAPETPVGITPFIRLVAKNEILLGRTDPQCQVYLDGEIAQAFDGFHRELYLPKKNRSDEFTIHVNAYTAEIERQLGIALIWCNRHDAAADLYFDLDNAFEAALRLDEHDTTRHRAFNIIDAALSALDLRARDKSFDYSVQSAKDIAQDLFDADIAVPTITAVGHTHIDVAWLWPVKQTREKMIRSMSTACKLLDENPDFTFMYNQCVLFDWLKEDAPELFERIKKHVQSGRFEIEGAMWLEPDVNLISGESLIRQILYGFQYQQSEFGVTPRTLWLPDTFGYTATIPQLMKGANLDIFVTSKCSWNDTNRMPYDTFEWQGIDGSNVTAFLITSQPDHLGRNNDPRTDYGHKLDVSTAVGSWNRYEPKALNDDVLMPFGHGDGGGGVTQEMIENARRMSKGLSGAPKVRMEGITPYFERLREKIASSPTAFPRWVGELYLEFHRGTLTSLAKNKRHNANAEHLMRELEWLAVLARRDGADIDAVKATIAKLWRIVMLNQFHDILPGTSIPEVYEDSDRDYAELFKLGAELKAQLLSQISTDGDLLFNDLGVARRNALVEIDSPDQAKTVDFGFGAKALQKIHRANGSSHLAAPIDWALPVSANAVTIIDSEPQTESHLSVSETHLENQKLRVEFDKQGNVTSIFDKAANRELIKGDTIANQLTVYEDKPLRWDAWDIDWFYEEKSWKVDAPTQIDVIEKGPHRAAIRLTRTYKNSTITQIISLGENAELIEFDFFADWKESQSLLKAEFEFDIQTDHVKSQIQFGHVSRATHRNTSWDAARFEASMHRWVAFEEEDYSIAILNDCKYGYSAKDTSLGITLIKSGTYPHPTADQEQHICRYAVSPVSGNNRTAKINRRAADFSKPLRVQLGSRNRQHNEVEQVPLLQWDQDNIILHSVKPSESGDAVVFRLCEESGRRTSTSLKLDERLLDPSLTNLLEEDIKPIPVDTSGAFELQLKPFEIVTIKANWT